MDLKHVLSSIGEAQCEGELLEQWDESVRTMPDTRPFFLEPGRVFHEGEWLGLPEDTIAEATAAANRIANDPALSLLAWHAYRRLFEATDSGGFGLWPALKTALGDARGCFYLLAGMAMLDRVRDKHQAMGVNPAITRDTCKQIASMNATYQKGHQGHPGINRQQIYWLRNYSEGRLFRLGRLEYRLGQFGGVYVFRHRGRGHVLALAEEGIEYDRNGYVDGAQGIEDVEGRWTSSFTMTEDEAAGFPVSPLGYVMQDPVRLPLSEWECVVRPGDAMLDMHIPSGGGMSFERCRDSMRDAAAFFRNHFAEKPCSVFWCSSWIFGPPLEVIFPPDANLVRFMRELYLFPVASPGNGGLWFVFLQDEIDPATIPRDTTLRRRIAEYLDGGGRWRQGGMFALVDKLDEYGTAPYRGAWPEVCALAGIRQSC